MRAVSKFDLTKVHLMLNTIKGFDVKLDRLMGIIGNEVYRKLVFKRVPKAVNRKSGGRAYRSGGQLRQSFKTEHRGFLNWEIYSPLADEKSGETPYGYWQELGHTPDSKLIFKKYSTPGTGKHFIKNAEDPAKKMLRDTVTKFVAVEAAKL